MGRRADGARSAGVQRSGVGAARRAFRECLRGGGRRPRGDERSGKSELCGGFWCRDSRIKESRCGFADSPRKKKIDPLLSRETVDEE